MGDTPRPEWTREEVQLMVRLRRAGRSRTEIAAAVGRSAQAVANRACRIGTEKPSTKWQEWEDQSLLLLYHKGRTSRQIGAELKRSPQAVRVRLNKKFGIWMDCRRPPVIYQTIRIQKADVPDYYELGWRFVGFDGGLCVFEWQSTREPLRPGILLSLTPEQHREIAEMDPGPTVEIGKAA